MADNCNSESADLVKTTKMTADGVKYEIGQPKPKEGADAGMEAMTHGPAFVRTVRWVPGGDWEDTDPDFARETGITRWKIPTGGVWYKYEIYFDTNQSFNYTFTDETGQGYGNDVFESGVHTINYNSDRPVIVQVSGI